MGTVTAVVAVAIIVVLVLGHRISKAADEEKMSVLRTLDGQQVRLGIARGGQIWFAFPHTGKLVIGPSSRFVTLIEGKPRAVALGHILWVIDNKTGQRYGGRRWALGDD